MATKTSSKSKTRATARKSTSVKETKIVSADRKLPKINKTVLLSLGIIFLLGALLYTFRSLFVVASVNGETIGRAAFTRELESQSGKQVLNSLITKTIILQEARKKNISVSNKEVSDEVKKIEANLAKQGQKLDQVLVAQGLSRSTLLEQIKLRKLVEKMVGTVSVTDKEAADFAEANKASLPEGIKPEDAKNQAMQQLKQQKSNEKIQAWLEKLQKGAKIDYFIKV